MPSEVAKGSQYETDVTVTPVDNCANVVIAARVPAGATYVKSEPNGTLEGNRLTWAFDALNKNETQNVKVWLKADQEGPLSCCFAILSAFPMWCASTTVGCPKIEIIKTAPAMASLNDTFTYTIQVKNPGTSIAKDVTVVDELPDGIVHESGERTLSFPVGDLGPNESKTITVAVKGTRTGTFVNKATANSSNVGSVSAEATTVIVETAMNFTVTCEPETTIGKRAKSGIVLNNTGTQSLTDVVVTAEWPEALKFLSSECGMQSTTGTSASWNIGELKGGENKTCDVIVTSKYPGEHCMKFTVTTGQGLTKEQSCCTRWRGMPAILIEVVDDPDPLARGDTTTYTIKVTNQGTADDRNITLKCVLPEEIEAVSASGATDCTVTPREITIAPYPVLSPKQMVEWKLIAKAIKGGDARIKIFLTSELLKNAVVEEEATQVYD